MPNPISPPNDASIAKMLIVIGMPFICHLIGKHLHLAFEAPQFPGFVTGLLTSINAVIEIPVCISCFGPHACFGYCLLQGSFNALGKILHSVTKLCGTGDIPCPTLSPRSSFNQDRVSSLSVGCGGAPFITDGDYFNTSISPPFISKLLEEEKRQPVSGGPSVISSFSHFTSLTNFSPSDIFKIS